MKVGLLERANGGTILLDEVTDMPLETQAKFVRILQEQSFERLGSDGQRVEMDIRILASTVKDIEHEVERKRFRQDLYYRLNVLTVRVPALKERPEDIIPLINYFLEKLTVHGLVARSLSSETLARLQAYEWPGNVRQLRNVIEHLLIIAQNGAHEQIPADILPAYITRVGPSSLDKEGAEEIMSLPLREARELFEKQYLNAQVMRFGGNISKTANFVGMERSALHRKLKSLGIGQLER
jgi:two-component system nitrogen regulation response regulator NtrX